jgi:hypothetical protein
MSAEDDEALTWDGDRDPSHVGSPWEKKAKKPKVDAVPTSEAPVAKQGPSSFLLISYGILGGMYLLYTVGWLVTTFNDNRPPFAEVVTEVMYQVGEYLAIASPAIWFLTVLALTRRSKPIVRLLVLVLGLFLLIPWPFVLLGA